MYQDLRQRFWWIKMKLEIARYVAKCDTCQRVKAIHLKTAGPLQSLPVPFWKWDDISMDFVVGLPKTSKGFDSIWVIVDHYYTNEYAQRCTFALRGGHLFLPAVVNPTIYHGGHFLFTAAGTFARHGKSIYRSGRLKMSATENMYFPWRAC